MGSRVEVDPESVPRGGLSRQRHGRRWAEQRSCTTGGNAEMDVRDSRDLLSPSSSTSPNNSQTHPGENETDKTKSIGDSTRMWVYVLCLCDTS